MTSTRPILEPRGPQRRRVLVAAALSGVLTLVACDSLSAEDRVSLDQARADLEAGRTVLIDIREPSEHATGVAKGAVLLPMSQLRARVAEIPVDPSRPVHLICNTQNRSRSVLSALREHGYAHVRFVEGGMSGWASRGWPMVKPGS
jgi:rhodanese-related sulfurtransferase